MATRERITLPAGTFEYLAEGDPSAPLALCLHGFPDHPPSFAPLLTALGQAGYRAVAPWLRGYAPSTLEGPFNLDRLTLDARLIGDALSPGRPFYLIGHDWGATITYTAAARFPARLAAAVTMAVPHPAAFLAEVPRHPSQLLRSWYMFFFQLPWIAERGVRRRDFALIDRLWRDWSPGYIPSPAEMRALKDCLSQSMPAPIAYYRAALRPTANGILRFINLKYERIVTPLLELAGAEDGCVDPRLGRNDVSMFLGPYRREILPGAGHFLVNEAPTAVAEHVLAWFAQHKV